MTLTDSLEALLVEHDRIGSPLRSELKPGPDAETVRRAIAATGLSPHSELVELFSWRDVAGSDRTTLFWPAAPPPPRRGGGSLHVGGRRRRRVEG